MSCAEILEKLIGEGFTSSDDEKLPIGVAVDAVIVYQRRGFGAVILSTRYLGVDVIRTEEFRYTDLTNNDKLLSGCDVIAWKHKEQEAAKP
ncbi:hypothetical protein PS870_06397 [Pseudomonas fluorescens]|uniref:Uncharacterized protein n=1 Tax=Pseudomonas fluorescens TaxID=294 RepID=A0A5E7QIL9_PSEFL|nr:hypothetical protein [Pseudomonas fluorescens]VVP61654.1 hypothetical protein PS870_06397 [Pseudomonas fluorescens]